MIIKLTPVVGLGYKIKLKLLTSTDFQYVNGENREGSFGISQRTLNSWKGFLTSACMYLFFIDGCLVEV